ncbi:hypothetical protein BHM03_00058061 [Ensete ventricosum]|nr:hypothetical protein BHM03_00058061 [Ensete ventricosum]
MTEKTSILNFRDGARKTGQKRKIPSAAAPFRRNGSRPSVGSRSEIRTSGSVLSTRPVAHVSASASKRNPIAEGNDSNPDLLFMYLKLGPAADPTFPCNPSPPSIARTWIFYTRRPVPDSILLFSSSSSPWIPNPGHAAMDLLDRVRSCHDYIRALEEERKKIEVFQRELPLCLKLEPPKKPIAVSVKRIGGAFQPFEREKHVVPPPASRAVAASSTNSAGGRGAGGGCGDSDGSSSSSRGDKEEEKEKEGQSQSHRKTRRCWSPDLHRRFLNALQQLGGSHGKPNNDTSSSLSLITRCVCI